MEFKQIQDLIKLVNKSNISEIRIEEDEFKISIKTNTYQGKIIRQEITQPIATSLPQMTMNVPMQGNVQSPSSVETLAAGTEDAKEIDEAVSANTEIVKSPMIGTFYRSASPDKPPFVKVGDHISVGDHVCIIEAMKLFNEIESEISGKIVKVLVDDATPVEYDQPLFLIDTSA